MSFTILRRCFPAAIETLSYSCTAGKFRVKPLVAAGSRIVYSSTATGNEADSSHLDVSTEFINRNPRNLERMGIERKTKGWVFQYPPRNFYHRLMFETTNRHTTGWVQHHTGRAVVTASTKEFALAKHLYSLTDVSASENVGKILADRCQKAGITNMSVLAPEHGATSEKYNAFQEAVVEGGVNLEEPEEVLPEYTPGINYSDKWEVENLRQRQLKVARTPRWTVFRYGQTKKHIKVKKYRD